MLVSGSFLNHNPKESIEIYNKSGIDFIHVDIADGKFVSEKSFSISDVEKFSTYTSKPLDIHLMVSNPTKYIDSFSMLNTEYITFHYEAVKNHMDIINHIKNNGIKVGISIKPGTSVGILFDMLHYIDLVLIMSVEPGVSGQKFMDSVIYKIEVLKKKIIEDNLNVKISVDGGINEESFNKIKDKGVDIIISESYLLSGDTVNKVRNLKS